MSVRGGDYGQRIADLFGMTDATWARHASGWSVWTRIATLPVLILAIASHVWLGWPAAAGLTALILVWLYINPRLFPRPRSTDNWAAKATFGERVWLDRRVVPIPAHHNLAAHLLSAAGFVGFAVALYGAVAGEFWPALLGVVLTYAAKLWFCDRMVWLYEDMKDRSPLYRSWLR
jgi:hypothetical protein